jgi:hypothetical protein
MPRASRTHPTPPMNHPAALAADKLFDQCDVRRLRRSGPGGQHRNKVETAICLHHRPSGVKAEASERRSQAENRSVALVRLRLNLALEIRGRPDSNIIASELWRSRLSGGRIAVSATHADFPTMLAEALDAIAAGEADVKRAADALGCTISQLVKFLKKEPRSLALVNRWRDDRGLHPLK